MISRDLRYAVRQLAQIRGLTLAAVVSLAIGVAAVATTSTWADQMLWRPLPGVHPSEGLIILTSRGSTGIPGGLSYPDYLDARTAVADLAPAAATALTPVTLSAADGQSAERVFVELVSDNYFATLGAAIVSGRDFRPEEASGAGRPVAIVSNAYWRARFSSDPAILGRVVHLNGQPFTVVGVADTSFRGGFVAVQTDLWLPLVVQGNVTASDYLTPRGRRWLQGILRLRPPATLQDLSTRLDAVSRRLAADYASTHRGRTLVADPIWRSPAGAQAALRPVLLPLGALAVFVFLLACTSVTNMLLATTLRRRRAFAIRLALGASRIQLVRQLVAEAFILAVLGGAGGYGMTIWAVDLLKVFQPPTSFRGDFNVAIDWTVGVVALGAGLASAFMIALLPLLDTLHSTTSALLREESHLIIGGRRRRIASALTALQVSFSVAVLVGCGLSLRSVERSRTLDPGFRAEGVTLASYDLTGSGYDEGRGATFHRELLQRVHQLPVVETASLASTVPFGLEGQSVVPIEIDGYTPGTGEDVQARLNLVGPAYFRTMSIPLAAGREFEWHDDQGSRTVAIVSRRFAARYFPGADPLGRGIRFRDRTFTIVGVAADVRYVAVEPEGIPMVYLSSLQSYRSAMTLHVRTRAAAGLPEFRRVVDGLDRGVPLFRVTTLDQQIEAATFVQRFAASLSLFLAIACLVLTAAGIYGLLRHSLAERIPEMAIRLALGASSHQVAGIVLRQALLITAAGVVAGVAGGMAVTSLLTGLLIDIAPTDPVAWGVAVTTAAGVVMVTGAAVARRAARIVPLAAVSPRASRW